MSFTECTNCVHLRDQLSKLRQELETERLRLVACGVAAMANTEKSVAERIGPDNPFYSTSYGDVCRAVDREMALRADLSRARAVLESATLEDEDKRDVPQLPPLSYVTVRIDRAAWQAWRDGTLAPAQDRVCQSCQHHVIHRTRYGELDGCLKHEVACEDVGFTCGAWAAK